MAYKKILGILILLALAVGSFLSFKTILGLLAMVVSVSILQMVIYLAVLLLGFYILFRILKWCFS